MVCNYFFTTNFGLGYSTSLKSILYILDFFINKLFIIARRLWSKLGLFNSHNFNNQNSSTPIFVLILVVEKDILLLQKCVEGVKENCLNPIQKIVIVSSNSEKIKSICSSKNVDWLDEKLLEPVSKEFIFNHYKNEKKNSWIYQQFLKLNIDTLFPNANCLIIDVDTILLQKQCFISNDKYILKTADEYHIFYRRVNQKLLDTKKIKWQSFIAHHQIISTLHLTLLKQKISHNSKENIWKILLNEIAINNGWFSEYELYGNYMNLFHKDKIELYYWNNYNSKNVKANKLNIEKISKKYSSVSLHNYSYEIYNA